MEVIEMPDTIQQFKSYLEYAINNAEKIHPDFSEDDKGYLKAANAYLKDVNLSQNETIAKALQDFNIQIREANKHVREIYVKTDKAILQEVKKHI